IGFGRREDWGVSYCGDPSSGISCLYLMAFRNLCTSRQSIRAVANPKIIRCGQDKCSGTNALQGQCPEPTQRSSTDGASFVDSQEFYTTWFLPFQSLLSRAERPVLYFEARPVALLRRVGRAGVL